MSIDVRVSTRFHPFTLCGTATPGLASSSCGVQILRTLPRTCAHATRERFRRPRYPFRPQEQTRPPADAYTCLPVVAAAARPDLILHVTARKAREQPSARLRAPKDTRKRSEQRWVRFSTLRATTRRCERGSTDSARTGRSPRASLLHSARHCFLLCFSRSPHRHAHARKTPR